MHICQIRIQNNLVIFSDSIANENSPKCTGTCLMGSEKINVVWSGNAGSSSVTLIFFCNSATSFEVDL